MNKSRIPWGWLWMTGALVLVIVGGLTRDRWWASAQSVVTSVIDRRKSRSSLDEHDHAEHDHAGHDHGADEHGHEGHPHGHDDSSSLELSRQAMGNIGLTPEFLRPLKLETFQRAITVPGIITERPGRTRVEVSTPMAGVITHVHAVQGEAVAPGTLLFQIRITAEALVATQTDLLKTAGEIEVENREIARLAKATEGGAIPQKSLLEHQYAKEKLEVLMGTHQEALRLLGLSERQIEDIVVNRKLLRELQILAPHPDDHSHDEFKLTGQAAAPVSYQPAAGGKQAPQSRTGEQPLVFQEVLVHKGQTVAAGQTLGIVADYSELYIEGQAFEQDVRQLAMAAQRGWRVTALIDDAGSSASIIPNLELVYSANAIRPDSRTLPFFVRLPNEMVKTSRGADGQSFVEWKYRLGQRLRVQVPVEEWPDRIVLPVDAVARDGAEFFVFQQNGDHFDRVRVKVDYRDSQSVVIANDGSIFPGDVVAMRGAHQMQMALKNKSGGGVDPHAGHNH
jgi:multidrug efflux pump subunit AcrA (membrane-fusion protein)